MRVQGIIMMARVMKKSIMMAGYMASPKRKGIVMARVMASL